MKKIVTWLTATALTAGCLAGCGPENVPSETTVQTANAGEAVPGAQGQVNGEGIKVVTTIFPEYDWVNAVLGDQAANAEVTMLLDNGVDLHSYQPTADDIMKISECDLFIYVGGESDEWVEGVLEQAENPKMQVINLLDVLGDTVVPEEIVEGMEHEHDHEHGDEEEHEHSHEKKEVTEDRTIADYEGEWQSVYPFMDEKFKEETVSYMAEAEGFDDEDEAWDFFYKGNETDVRYINIKGDTIEFIREDGTKTSGTYEYDGFYSDCWGETSIRYQFKNTDSESDAPKYVQFDDHLNYSVKAEHFHVYCGDDGKEMLDIMYNWPTYYPADIDDEDEMIHEFLKHYISDEDEADEDHDHEHEDEADEDHDHEHEHEEEMDEHVWLSLKNAQIICTEIADVLGNIDSANAEAYAANASAYNEQLAALDAQYREAVNSAEVKTFLFGDRFPFRYLADDYGLEYYAAFSGCSAESEASFETVVFLADKVDELGLPAILTIEGNNNKIAETVRENTDTKDQKILMLDSMQSTTSADIANGKTYLSVMESNLETLKDALAK